MPFMIKWPFFKKNKKDEEIDKTKVFCLGALEDKKPCAYATIAVTAGPDAGRKFVFGEEGAYIGRKNNCKIHLNDPNISRYHAFFGWEGKKLYLEDRGSTNGTFVNGQVIRKKFLRAGDRIVIGDTEIVLKEVRG